jgi:hypothetical protein
MMKAICRLFALLFLSFIAVVVQAQPPMESKPYKLLASGRQITISSIKNIKQVMVWTTGGNRVVEQKEINKNSFVLNIPVNHKTFFLMIGLIDGKIYTEKIGIL